MEIEIYHRFEQDYYYLKRKEGRVEKHTHRQGHFTGKLQESTVVVPDGRAHGAQAQARLGGPLERAPVTELGKSQQQEQGAASSSSFPKPVRRTHLPISSQPLTGTLQPTAVATLRAQTIKTSSNRVQCSKFVSPQARPGKAAASEPTSPAWRGYM